MRNLYNILCPRFSKMDRNPVRMVNEVNCLQEVTDLKFFVFFRRKSTCINSVFVV